MNINQINTIIIAGSITSLWVHFHAPFVAIVILYFASKSSAVFWNLNKRLWGWTISWWWWIYGNSAKMPCLLSQGYRICAYYLYIYGLRMWEHFLHQSVKLFFNKNKTPLKPFLTTLYPRCMPTKLPFRGLSGRI